MALKWCQLDMFKVFSMDSFLLEGVKEAGIIITRKKKKEAGGLECLLHRLIDYLH